MAGLFPRYIQKFLRIDFVLLIRNLLTNIISSSIEQNKFPLNLEQAGASPIFKKKDPLIRENYMPACGLFYMP